MTIARFIARRLLGGIALLFLLSFVVFGLIAISPGSPLQALIGTRPPSPDLIAALKAQYHLNDPFLVQYWHWLGGAVRFNFGQSISVQTDSDVSSVILGRLSLTLQLAAYALVVVMAVGIPVGMVAGIRHGGRVDRAVSLMTSLAIGAPSYVLAVLALYVFGARLRWFPIYGTGSGFFGRIEHLTLPMLVLAVIMSAFVARQTRAATLTVMQQDYVTFARIRGLSRRRVLVRYALRNSSLPVVTSMGIFVIVALSAGVFIEQVFSLPGAGSLLLAAVTAKDIPLVQGMAILIGAVVVVINLVVDLLALVLDPRTRFTSRAGA